MMDQKNLKSLVRMMVENDLTELELQDAKGEKVVLKRGGMAAPAVQYVAAPAPAPVATTPATPAAAPAAPAVSAAATAADDTAGLVAINSPMVGTFYAAPSPEAKPFVNVGARVSADTVVCVIEAMKVFNEIKAETTGTVAKVAVTSGKAVEFGQPLFWIKPG